MRLYALFLVLLGYATMAMAAGGKVGSRQPLRNSQQALLVVSVGGWDATTAIAQRYERKRADGRWHKVGDPFAVVVGKNGLAWGTGLHEPPAQNEGPRKHEGDGRAPAGVFLLPETFGYSASPLPDGKMPYRVLKTTVECVDDDASQYYNRLLDNQAVAKDWKSSERMLRPDNLYQWGVLVAHNMSPTGAGGGSCIFLHVWSGPGQPTVGCTAMDAADIQSLLAWLDAGKNPVLVQLPANEYERLRKQWALPKR